MGQVMIPAADWLVATTLRPVTKGELAPLYEAALAGRLAMPFCGSCSALPLELDQTSCDVCAGQKIVWRDVDLRGTVHSATTVHRLEPGLVVTAEPYPVVDVELASGHRLLMSTTAPAPCPAIGSAVTVGFRHLDGVALPAVKVRHLSTTASPVDSSERGPDDHDPYQ